MKKYKTLMASILSFILAITALLGSIPVYAAEQVYVDDPDLAGTVIKVSDNGTEGVHLNERIMMAGSETVYCIDINVDFEAGYKTRYDAATEMSQEQITDIALCLVYPRLINRTFGLSKFPSAALASIDDATGIASFSRLADENLSCAKCIGN